MPGQTGWQILYPLLQKLDKITLAGCGNDPQTYVDDFTGLMQALSGHFSEVYKIYRFHEGLGSLYNSYIEQYDQNHEPFDAAGKSKFDLDYAVTRFINTVTDPTWIATATAKATALAALTDGTFGHTPHSVLALLVKGLPSDVEIRDPSLFKIQAGAHAGNSRTYSMTVKHCTRCKMDWHDDSECVQLRPKRRNRR